jgi:hypothetical protein
MGAVYRVPTQNNQQYTLDTQYTSGGSSLTLNQSVTGVVQAPGVCVVDRVDSSGTKTPTKRTYYAFTGVSGAQLTGLTTVDGTDQNHAVGAIVEFVADVDTINSYYDALSQVVDTSTGALDMTKVVDPSTAQTLTNKTLTSPKIGTSILDTNGNEVVKITATSSAVNEITVANGAANNNPIVSATGDDTNIGITITPKGTGKLSVSANDVTIATGANIQVNGADPKRAYYVPANGMFSATTNGAATGQLESSSNKVNTKVLDFDASTEEYAHFGIPTPLNWDAGTVTAQFYWTAASGSGDVIWGLQGLSISNDDALDQAYGTGQTATDTLIAANDLHISSATSAITIAGTPAAGDFVQFRVYRKAADGGDTLGVDARLIGIRIEFGIAKYDDIA